MKGNNSPVQLTLHQKFLLRQVQDKIYDSVLFTSMQYIRLLCSSVLGESKTKVPRLAGYGIKSMWPSFKGFCLVKSHILKTEQLEIWSIIYVALGFTVSEI